MAEDPTPFLHQVMPLGATLGMRAVSLARDDVVLELDFSDGLTTSGGIMHGGTIMALADAAGACCAFANLPEGAAGTATIESKTNMLRAVRDGTVRATSTVLHAGSTTIVVETEVRDDRDRLVAKTTQTQAVLRPS
jgi:uncharacterized protein (TIGR00369 family)